MEYELDTGIVPLNERCSEGSVKNVMEGLLVLCRMLRFEKEWNRRTKIFLSRQAAARIGIVWMPCIGIRVKSHAGFQNTRGLTAQGARSTTFEPKCLNRANGNGAKSERAGLGFAGSNAFAFAFREALFWLRRCHGSRANPVLHSRTPWGFASLV